MQFSKTEQTIISVLNDSRYQFIFFSLLLYLVCVFEYKNFVVVKYEYMGFRNHFSFEKAIFSFLLYSVSIFVVFLRSTRFIKGISGLIVAITLMPILIVYQFDELGMSYIAATVLLLMVINLSFKFKLLFFTRIDNRQLPILLLFMIILGIIPFLIAYPINLDPSLFAFGEEIYSVRESIKGMGNIFTGYMLSPLVQVLLPMLAVYGLSQKKIYFTIISIVLSVIIFMMIPQKSIFLGIYVVLFFYFFKDPLRKVSVFLGLVLGLLILGILLTYISDSLIVESLLLRRYFIIPAYLNHVYLEFFDGMQLRYSYSFLSSFFTYPFEVGPTFLIGQEAFGNIETNANNGFMSDAFMNFGYWGLFGFTVLVGLIIKFFDELSIHAKFFGLFFLLLNSLRSSALPTIMLTHGLWLLLVLSFFLLRNSKSRTV